jgi:GTP-binding protein Era
MNLFRNYLGSFNNLLPPLCLEQPPNAHRLSVAIIGAANTGKSTLVNGMLGKKLAIVSKQPHSTRDKLLAIMTSQTSDKNTQLLIYDTPGFVEEELMRQHVVPRSVHSALWSALDISDKIIWMMDINRFSKIDVHKDNIHVKRIRDFYQEKPIILVINKSDYLSESERKHFVENSIDHKNKIRTILTENHKIEEVFLTSALNNWNVLKLKSYLIQASPPDSWVYASNVITDRNPVELAQEAIRQQLFLHFFQEIPYLCEFELIDFNDSLENQTISLAFDIIVSRDSQRRIILGKQRHLLKKTEQAAAEELSFQLRRNVYLHINVKVK